MTDIPSSTHLGTIFTAKEAAARLKMTQRGVITLGKRYGCCSTHGRAVLFSEQDLLDIWQVMRAPATETKPVSARAVAFYSADASYKDLLRTTQRKQEEKRRLRKEREAADRERRLEEKRRASCAKVEARTAKREAKAQELAAKRAAKAVLVSELDRKNRDASYWTDERKEALRQERVANVRERSQ